MSTAFGSTDTLADCSLSERMAARLFSWWVPLLNALLDRGSVRFDRERVRIGLHGESEHPGDGYTRGMAVAGLWLGNAALSALPVLLIGEMPVPESLVLQVVLLVALVSSTALFYGGAIGSCSLIFETELVDHTVPEQPREELAAAREAFVDGDLDEAEFGLSDERRRAQRAPPRGGAPAMVSERVCRTLPLYLVERYLIYNWRLHAGMTVSFIAFSVVMNARYGTGWVPALIVAVLGTVSSVWNKARPVTVVRGTAEGEDE